MREKLPQFRVSLVFTTSDGTVAFTTTDSSSDDYDTKPFSPGTYVARCLVPGDLLNEGFYSLTLGADIPFKKVLFVEEGAIGFFVEQTGGVATRFAEKWAGVICPRLHWETAALQTAAAVV